VVISGIASLSACAFFSPLISKRSRPFFEKTHSNRKENVVMASNGMTKREIPVISSERDFDVLCDCPTGQVRDDLVRLHPSFFSTLVSSRMIIHVPAAP